MFKKRLIQYYSIVLFLLLIGSVHGQVNDLSIKGVEVTQATQCFDTSNGYTNCADNSLKLNSDKSTSVRVYVGHNESCSGTDPYAPVLSDVTVRLSWCAIHQPVTCIPSPDSIVDLTFNVPCSTNLDELRDDAKGSANYVIKPELLGKPNWEKTLRVSAEVIPPTSITDINPGNNQGHVQLGDNDPVTEEGGLIPHEDFNVKWIYVYYNPAPSGYGLPKPKDFYADGSVVGAADGLLKKTYPMHVNYSLSPTVLYYDKDKCSDCPDVRVDDQTSANRMLISLAWAKSEMDPEPDALFGWLPLGSGSSAVRGLATSASSVGWCTQDKDSLRNEVCLAHELGHTHGVDHVNELGCPIEILEAGYDGAYDAAYSTSTYDYMKSNAGSGWISPYVWSRIFGTAFGGCPSTTTKSSASSTFMLNDINTTGEPAEAFTLNTPIPTVQVSGLVNNEGPAVLDHMFQQIGGEPFSSSNPAGDYCLEFKDSENSLLSKHCFDLSFTELESGKPSNSSGFFFKLPLNTNTKHVLLKKGESVLAERIASVNPPEVEITQPVASTMVTSPLTIAWSGTDSDSDSLRYNVLYTPDGGNSYSPIAVQIEGESLEVDGDYLAGGDNASIKVIASDGLHTSEAESEIFQVSRKAPVAHISHPATDTLIHSDEQVILEGTGQDLEDGVLSGSSMVWNSDVTGDLGVGSQLILAAGSLPDGKHEITLTAADSDTYESTDSITLYIDATNVDAWCNPDQVDLALKPGDPFDINFRYRNGTTTPVQFIATMEENDFMGAAHIIDSSVVSPNANVPGGLVDVIKSIYNDTSTFEPGSDQILINITTDKTGSAVLGRCNFVLAINEPPVLSVSPESQIIQYSDVIEAIIISATDGPSDDLSIETSWNLNGGDYSIGLPDGFELNDGVCTINGDRACGWTISGNAAVPAGSYTVRIAVSDGNGGVTEEDVTVNVLVEDATINFDGGNPVAVPVSVPGGRSGPFTLLVHTRERVPDDAVVAPSSGDISNAVVNVSLMPIGPGSLVVGMCMPGEVTGTNYDAVLPVTCIFDDVIVNTYAVEVTVNGGYYVGESEDVLTVYDPSLGFTTGGGWFYWPNTSDKTNFGYTMKYNKKATNVKGGILLIRHLNDGSIYRIKSNALSGLALGETTSYGWASFSGKATYLEPSWLEPEGKHKFITYVEDHGEPGVGVDHFWIEIKDKNGTPISAMSMDRPTLDNTIVISGGNIVVPH